MADPKDDVMGGRAAYDSDRTIQKDQRILGRARHKARVTAQVAPLMGTIDRSRPSTSQRVDGTARRHIRPR
jgi:hypothetical protein